MIYYKEEVLLGVGIGSNLTFKEHVTSTCSKANHLAGMIVPILLGYVTNNHGFICNAISEHALALARKK